MIVVDKITFSAEKRLINKYYDSTSEDDNGRPAGKQVYNPY